MEVNDKEWKSKTIELAAGKAGYLSQAELYNSAGDLFGNRKVLNFIIHIESGDKFSVKTFSE
jgi:hypothetical protein